VKQETGKKWKNEKKLKKSGREFLFHYFDMGKSNLVFRTVSDNSWIRSFGLDSRRKIRHEKYIYQSKWDAILGKKCLNNRLDESTVYLLM
jgi:hypothetical protein